MWMLPGCSIEKVDSSLTKLSTVRGGSDEGVKDKGSWSCLVLTAHSINFLVKFLRS